MPWSSISQPVSLEYEYFPPVLMDDKCKRGKEKDGSTSAPPHRRKGGLRFKPRVPTKKASKAVPKMEPGKESEFRTIDKDLLMKLRTPQSMLRALEGRSNAENNEACVQVAFGPADPSIARSFHTPQSSPSVKKEKDVHLFSKSMLSDVTTSAAKLPKQCAEPQDFTHPDYNYPPITMPPRRHYSGDPEFFDEEDFSEFSSSRAQDGEITAAQELGLMDTDEMTSEPQLFLVQFPSSLPLPRQVEADMDTSEDVETEGTKSKESIRGCKLKDLPGGLMGKVLVYKSGKVKMRLGDALFDVSAGLNCAFAQDAVAININKKHCCSLGEVNKRAIVTPDIEYLVDSAKKID
uniref:Uncharacterized protein n=1 Tax=Avena sativa TaxID=4498 RepID=A0ACD5W922_AVESA